jgi:hypothetical protein
MSPTSPLGPSEAAERPQEELPKGVPEEPQEEPQEEQDQFVLPPSTAPALLENSTRPKRARGPTLDYKAMHEGRQMALKRGK